MKNFFFLYVYIPIDHDINYFIFSPYSIGGLCLAIICKNIVKHFLNVDMI
jgi:hypothetical protein